MHEENEWGISVEATADETEREPERFVEAPKEQSLADLMSSMK